MSMMSMHVEYMHATSSQKYTTRSDNHDKGDDTLFHDMLYALCKMKSLGARVPSGQISQITRLAYCRTRAHASLATNFDRKSPKSQKMYFCALLKKKKFKGGIIACTQRAGILVRYRLGNPLNLYIKLE